MRTAQKPGPVNRSGDYTNMLRWREPKDSKKAYEPYWTEEVAEQVVPPANSPEPKDMEMWKPIADAPQDGRVIIGLESARNLGGTVANPNIGFVTRRKCRSCGKPVWVDAQLLDWEEKPDFWCDVPFGLAVPQFEGEDDEFVDIDCCEPQDG